VKKEMAQPRTAKSAQKNSGNHGVSIDSYSAKIAAKIHGPAKP
jgi:hypothetical protein